MALFKCGGKDKEPSALTLVSTSGSYTATEDGLYITFFGSWGSSGYASAKTPVGGELIGFYNLYSAVSYNSYWSKGAVGLVRLKKGETVNIYTGTYDVMGIAKIEEV